MLFVLVGVVECSVNEAVKVRRKGAAVASDVGNEIMDCRLYLRRTKASKGTLERMKSTSSRHFISPLLYLAVVSNHYDGYSMADDASPCYVGVCSLSISTK